MRGRHGPGCASANERGHLGLVVDGEQPRVGARDVVETGAGSRVGRVEHHLVPDAVDQHRPARRYGGHLGAEQRGGAVGAHELREVVPFRGRTGIDRRED